MNLEGGLTQVLSDGTNTYLYGTGRIAQYDISGPQYFLSDALGSVRQLSDPAGEVMMAKDYQPYGEALFSAGTATSSYGFTGEWTSPVNQGDLVFLRARRYAGGQGRFLTADPFRGFPVRPKSLQRYTYTENNPVNFTDPAGLFIGPLPPLAPLPGYLMNLVRSLSGGCRLPGFGLETGNWLWPAFGQFATGLSYEYARSIAWASPQAQLILGPGSQDTGWMLAGRIAGDLLAIGSGADLISGKFGTPGTSIEDALSRN